MKRLLISLFFAFFSINGFSQVFLIDLQKQPISLPDRNFYIKQVVDARTVKTTIGQVRRGPANVKVNANLRNGPEIEILACLNNSLPPKADFKPLIMKVVKLKIYERTQVSTEAATAELAVEFFVPDGEAYLPVHRAAAVVQRKGLDVTTRHNDNIAEALQKCLRQLLESAWDEHPPAGPAVSWAEVTAPAAELEEAQDYPIFRAEMPAKGIYGSFREFRDNRPGVTDGFTIESKPRAGKEWRGTNEVAPSYANANGVQKQIRKVWGFSDGSTCYILFRGEYFPLEIQDNVVTFYGYSGPDQAAVTAGSIAGGLTGVLIASAATSKGKARYIVDMLTGEHATFDVDSDEGRSLGGIPARITIYCRDNKAARPVQVTLKDRQDSLTAELGPNSFTELEWMNLRDDVLACVEGQTGDCLQFLPSVDQPNYLELIPADKTHPQPTLRAVKAQEAEFYLKKIRYAQEIEQRRRGK